MLSDLEICEYYKIDLDDVGAIEDVQFLLEVDSFQNQSMFNSLEKLEEIHTHLASISYRILDGTRSDELCDLLDDTFYRFRNLKRIIKGLVASECNQSPSILLAANDASLPCWSAKNQIDLNQLKKGISVRCSSIIPDFSPELASPNFSSMTLNERVNRLLYLVQISEYCRERASVSEEIS